MSTGSKVVLKIKKKHDEPKEAPPTAQRLSAMTYIEFQLGLQTSSSNSKLCLYVRFWSADHSSFQFLNYCDTFSVRSGSGSLVEAVFMGLLTMPNGKPRFLFFVDGEDQQVLLIPEQEADFSFLRHSTSADVHPVVRDSLEQLNRVLDATEHAREDGIVQGERNPVSLFFFLVDISRVLTAATSIRPAGL